MSELTVFLIDDNEIELFLMSKLITFSGISTTDKIYRHIMPNKALKALENEGTLPDLILLDIQMPAVDGFAFLDYYEKIMSAKKQKSCIVMISSTLDFGDISKAEAHPLVAGFIKKPLDPAVLHEILKKEHIL